MTANPTAVFQQYARHVSSGKAAFFEDAEIDFVLGKREGPYMWNLAGDKRLINCHCNGGVFNLGHRHPKIIAALTEGTQTLDIGNHHAVSQGRAELAAKLAELAPGNLQYTVFGVGGGETVDTAIKIARGYTGRQEIISAKMGYHGHTGLALATGDAMYYEPFGEPAPGFRQVAFNDTAVLEETISDATAAVILETVPATAGILIPAPDYHARVRQLCDQHGALLIIDEIQTGLGRTGKFWGIEHYGVEPDIMVTGKGLSGGLYPIAATCFKPELESVFHADPFIHVSTFGGSELGCAVAMKVLEISGDAAFLAHVEALTAVFAAGLAQLQQKYPNIITGINQLGLMMGIQMADEFFGPLFTKAAYQSGILSVYANNDPRVAQFLPPLNIEMSLAHEILQRTDAAFDGIARYLAD